MAKSRIGAIEENLVKKTKLYKELTGTSTVELVEKLLTEFFNEIKLNNEYIYIDEIYYFNFEKLLIDKEVKATKNKLSEDLKKTYIIKKIPNNLDEFDKLHTTFCYNGNPKKHLGIYSYNEFISQSEFKDTELFQCYILFYYDEKTEELILKLIELSDIALIIKLDNHSSILTDLSEFNKIFIEELERIKKIPEKKKMTYNFRKPLFEYDNPLIYLGSTTVIESYINAKKMAKDIYTIDPKLYRELKGKYDSEDLVIFREGRLIKYEEIDNIKQIEKYSSN